MYALYRLTPRRHLGDSLQFQVTACRERREAGEGSKDKDFRSLRPLRGASQRLRKSEWRAFK